MSDTVRAMHDRAVLVCDPEGPAVDGGNGALDLIGDAWGHSADVVALPVDRLDDSFFDLSSGLAGEVLQKFVNYRMPLAIIGSITSHLDASSALRAFVAESNRGQQVWFLADLAELDHRLASAG